MINVLLIVIISLQYCKCEILSGMLWTLSHLPKAYEQATTCSNSSKIRSDQNWRQKLIPHPQNFYKKGFCKSQEPPFQFRDRENKHIRGRISNTTKLSSQPAKSIKILASTLLFFFFPQILRGCAPSCAAALAERLVQAEPMQRRVLTTAQRSWVFFSCLFLHSLLHYNAFYVLQS